MGTILYMETDTESAKKFIILKLSEEEKDFIKKVSKKHGTTIRSALLKGIRLLDKIPGIMEE